MKNSKKKPGKLSIRWNIFIYMVGFVLLLLAILWIFQIVLLKDFYEAAKRREFKSAIRIVREQYDEGTLESYASQIAEDYDIRILVLNDAGSNVISSSGSHFDYKDEMMNTALYNYVVADAAQKGGDVTYEVEAAFFGDWRGDMMLAAIRGDAWNMEPGFHEPGQRPNGAYQPRDDFGNSKSLIYGSVVQDDAGSDVLLLVSMTITPISATVYTLRYQFVWIAIIFFVIACLVCFGVSMLVARPIVRINASAKKLASGDFDVEFEERGFREINELTDTLNYAAKELGRTEKLRQELIANVSHDLRTPLTMITAYSEVMRDLPGENTPENAQVIIDESKRLTNLVNDMLDLSKLQAGAMQLQESVFHFTQSIRAVMNRFAKLKEQDGYDIRFEYDEEVYVRADEYKVYQVVYNLIINAIHYVGEDKTVIVRQVVCDNKVRLEIEDHGCGIAKDELRNIWDRYYKVDKTHKRAIQGTGLGLSIVQKILELHAAEYGVNSVVGEGSVFWFELLTVPAEADDHA